MKTFIYKYKHGWILSYMFIYFIWFLYLENRTDIIYTSMHSWVDDYIPFNELFVIPYILWFAYIVITVLYFFFTSKEEFYHCTAFLFIGMTICLIIYTLWPNAQDLRVTDFERNNIFVDLVKVFYANDTSTNVCPSIHCFNSIGAHIAISRNARLKKYPVIQAVSFVLMISICLSTMFIKQHSFVDFVAAIVLSIIMYFAVYKLDYSALFVKEKKTEEEASL